MTHDDVQAWLDRYVEAWRTYDPTRIGDLFSDEATYRPHPWDEPLRGRAAIVADWLGNQDAPGSWEAAYEPLLVAGDTAVTHGQTRYVTPDGNVQRAYRNLWVLRFDGDGRCRDFTEWFMKEPSSEAPA
jgi:ketosteroid isomerase-like protein